MSIGERMSQRRTELGLSQRGLARKASVPVSVVNEVESGARSGEHLQVKTARKLADALLISVDRFLGEAP